MIDNADVQAVNDLFETIDREQLDDEAELAHLMGRLPSRFIGMFVGNYLDKDGHRSDLIEKTALAAGWTVTKENVHDDFEDMVLKHGSVTVRVATPKRVTA